MDGNFWGLIFYTYVDLFRESLLTVPSALWYVLPPFLVYITWQTWLDYAQALFIQKMDWVLLEIRIPKEITKPPQSMEIVLEIFNQGNDGTFIERWWQGFVRQWFSLEIASIGGNIHFYVRTIRKFKNAIESQIYSQYSDAEVFEVPDYTLDVPYAQEGSSWNLWATNFKLDKDDFYPIKTYVDYELDKSSTKEEFKVDPLTPVLELLGSIGPEEQVWMQILLMSSKKRFNKKGSWFKMVDWKENAKEEINKLQKRDKKIKQGEFPNPGEFTQTPQEKIAAEAISRSMAKTGFDCGYRVVYLAKTDKFNPGIISGIIGTVKQYSSAHLNGFKLGDKVGFDYPWEDITGNRIKRIRWQFFDAYRKRSYFYAPYRKKPMVLNTEEVATIYRFPGLVASTPSLIRTESKRAEPPTNLPI